MNIPEPTGWVAALLGALGGAGSVGAAVLMLRRQLSRDGVEIVKDRTEVDILQTVVKERDQLAIEAQRLRELYIDSVRKIERLESDSVGDLETIERLERDNRLLLQFAPDDVRRARETNFSPLGPPEVKP